MAEAIGRDSRSEGHLSIHEVLRCYPAQGRSDRLSPLPEDFIFLSVKEYLREKKWQILGGEPPDGTNDIPRIAIRPREAIGRFHSLGAMKVDLISENRRTILLTEVKPRYSRSDKEKLDKILTERRPDLNNALWERCKIPSGEIQAVIGSMGFSAGQRWTMDNTFVYFEVNSDGSISVRKGDQVAWLEV